MSEERDATGRRAEGRERGLAALLDATRELMIAEDAETVARTVVEAASDRLGHELVGVHLLPDAPLTERAATAAESPHVALEPVAWTDALVDLIGRDPPPDIEPGSGVAWESFERGELRVFDDVRAAKAELMDPDTAFRSELHVPLGRYGVLIIGSAEVAEFDDRDVYFARILAANTVAALDNLAARREVERREQELARQNRRLEEFADVIGHDLRNPLSVARGRLELGLESGDREEFERVDDALDRIEALVDGLLSLAKEGRAVGETTTVDVAAVAERAWRSVETEGATLRTTPAPGVAADADRLRQLLENLFRNTVEHGSASSRPGADDAVEHAATDPAGLTVSVGPLDDGPGFYVADDGVGIPDGLGESALEHGVSGADGTGLGLAIVRTIAEAHGWAVATETGADGGARFEFRTDEQAR
jgi:signal transduction histidine kinase